MPSRRPAHPHPVARLACIVAGACLAVGCSAPAPPRPQPASDATGSRLAESSSASDAVTRASERAKAIQASGRTGVWITPAAICMRDARAGRKATLGWNVEARGIAHVIAYVVDKHGDEARFAQAGPIGERQTGAWLRPGLAFRLRDADSHALLGSVVVADASCD